MIRRRMVRFNIWLLNLFTIANLALPNLAIAGGGETTQLIFVADTRRIDGFLKYFADLYNSNILIFAIWSVVLTALAGAILGLLMDFIMSKTGIDLKSRKIIEH